jgi:mannose-6-phosphate isomerase-like protein (cupin superfamily)
MENVWFIAGLSQILAAQDGLSIVHMWVPAGDQPPLHVHWDEDECFYVLAGSLTLWVGDREPVSAGPGEFVVAPRGIAHTYLVGESGGEFLVTTNGSFGAFTRAAGRPASRLALPDGPGDVSSLARIASEHRIELLGPPGMLPSELEALAA